MVVLISVNSGTVRQLGKGYEAVQALPTSHRRTQAGSHQQIAWDIRWLGSRKRSRSLHDGIEQQAVHRPVKRLQLRSSCVSAWQYSGLSQRASLRMY